MNNKFNIKFSFLVLLILTFYYYQINFLCEFLSLNGYHQETNLNKK